MLNSLPDQIILFFLYKNFKKMDIKIENFTKKYGPEKAVDNISFEVKTGEVLVELEHKVLEQQIVNLETQLSTMKYGESIVTDEVACFILEMISFFRTPTSFLLSSGRSETKVRLLQ